MPKDEKVLAIFSGGMDSATLLAHLIHEGYDDVAAVSFNYGQRHKRELLSAEAITNHYDIDWDTVDITRIGIRLSGSALTSKDVAVPHGLYDEESMKQTVVPNRNMIMISIAAGIAYAKGFHNIAIGVHAGDHAIYPDCRPEFVKSVTLTLARATEPPVGLLAPFINLSKAQICRYGAELGVPFEMTWSCYEGGNKHCGRCGTCVERIEAFHKAGVTDPTEYLEGPEWALNRLAEAGKI